MSGANVAMPKAFLKPLDYSVDLLVRSHPTLRQYQAQIQCSEVDPEYRLYPIPRPRVMPKDEVEMKNQKKSAQDSATQLIASRFPF